MRQGGGAAAAVIDAHAVRVSTSGGDERIQLKFDLLLSEVADKG